MNSTTNPTAPATSTCAQCEGFGDIRPATCTARYQPAAQGQPGKVETLCDSCAANPMIYCDIKPLTPAGDPAPRPTFLPTTPAFPTLPPTARPLISLAKQRTARSAPPRDWGMVPCTRCVINLVPAPTSIEVDPLCDSCR